MNKFILSVVLLLSSPFIPAASQYAVHAPIDAAYMDTYDLSEIDEQPFKENFSKRDFKELFERYYNDATVDYILWNDLSNNSTDKERYACLFLGKHIILSDFLKMNRDYLDTISDYEIGLIYNMADEYLKHVDKFCTWKKMY